MSKNLYIGEEVIPFENIVEYVKWNDVSEYPWKKDLLEFIAEWLGGKMHFEIPTSGSTGTSKVINVHRKDMILSAEITANYLKLNQDNSALLCLPVKYIAGKMMVVRALEIGLDLFAVEPSSNPLIQVEQKINFAAFTPQQVSNILDSEESLMKFQSIKTVIIGGAPLPQSMDFSSFQNNIYHTYGMTETLSHIAMRKLNGLESNWETYELINPSFKISVGQNQCLEIETPYQHAPYLKTKDIVEIFSDQSFSWKSRLDNVINSGGIKIYPEEIEKKLQGFIDESFFIASLSDEILGEKTILIIEKEECSESYEIIIKELVSNTLQGNERPKEIIFLSKFIYTETNKINRKATAELIPFE